MRGGAADEAIPGEYFAFPLSRERACNGGLFLFEDLCPAAGVGGPASGTSECFPGSEPHDSGTMDTRCESGRDSGSGIQTPARPGKGNGGGGGEKSAGGGGENI